MSSLYQFNMNKSHFVLFVFLLLYVKFNSAIDCEANKWTAEQAPINEAKLPDQQMDKSKAKLKEKEHSPINATQATSCRDYPNSDGIETIRVPGTDSFEVRCNSHSAGEGWTEIMRKSPYSDKFNKTWNEYKNGFGNLSSEFWIGLDKLHHMTKFQSHDMLVVSPYYALLRNFTIANEAESYKVLTIDSLSLMPDGVLEIKTDVKFTTTDRDNDNDTFNCAHKFEFGWWFDKCPEADELYNFDDIAVLMRPTSK